MPKSPRAKAMSESAAIELPSHVPVMVLPGAMLFPQALLPLYIFEPRYRQMLANCLAGSRMFCVAMTKPGVEEVQGPKDFFQVAGCGLIRACVGQEDGTSNLILQGMGRVRFTGWLQETPFRVAEITPVESEDSRSIEAEALGVKVVELCQRFKEQGAQIPDQLDVFLAQLSNPEMLADLVAHKFVGNPFQRQKLLEEASVPARLRLLIRYLNAELT